MSGLSEIDKTKYRVSSMFAFGCIIWTLLHVFTCTCSAWLISDNKIIKTKMVYHSDEIPLDIGYSLTVLLPMHCVYWNFDIIKNVLSWYKATFPIFKNHTYFSVRSIALNDVNVRGGNVIKPFAREIGNSQKFVSLRQIKGKWVRKLWICDLCMLNVSFRKYSMPFYFC